MAITAGCITNFNVANVRLVAPTAFPAEVLASFDVPLVLPNKFHKYALFSRALYASAAIVGYLLAEYDADTGDVHVRALELLPAYNAPHIAEEALALLRADVEAVKELPWAEGAKLADYAAGKACSSEQIRRLQMREALGDRPLGQVR